MERHRHVNNGTKMFNIGFYICLLCSKFVWGVLDGSSLKTEVLIGEYNVPYNINVNRDVEYIYEFDNDKVSLRQPARITVACENSNRTFPVLIVVRQQKGVLSWQLPLIVETKSGVFGYQNTSRTLCPDNNYYKVNNVNQQVIVSVSTANPSNFTVSLEVTMEPEFFIELQRPHNISVSPAEPRYYGYKFEEGGPSTVLLRVDSEDDICMTVSVQNMSCPVFDLERNVQFEGYWQTMNTRGGITLTRDVFPHGFYVVFVVKGDDMDCSGEYQTVSEQRRKVVSFTLKGAISAGDYLVATLSALALFASFYLLALAMALAHWARRRGQASVVVWSEPGGSDQISETQSSAHLSDTCAGDSDSSLDETDIDMLRDADKDKDIFRTKLSLSIRDLARKHPRILQKKSQLYLWNLLTVGMFYALPVVQLVLTYQNVLHETGNQDLCYYNFLCAHPLGFLSDFNHVFSNLGYVLLGLLFVGLTYRRDMMHRKVPAAQDKMYGIPQHYGLFYAMGAALIMEGIMSGCYHVCPNHSNFQFDTSFMYVMAMVSMVKIYQTRHPDINASAYATYGVLAAVIFIGMCGVLDGSLTFWVVFTVIHLLSCLLLTVQIYYMGRWRLELSAFKRVLCTCYMDARVSTWRCLKPNYPSRMVLLLLGNACNWALASFGLKYHLDDVATHMLMIFMANLLLYYHFYIVMKLLSGETILTQPLIFILLSFISWGGALYFFFNKSISWALTAAGSKTFNRPCTIMDFYDNHDIWHFSSAGAMFFSFMVLLTLDDDLVMVHRSKIPVF